MSSTAKNIEDEIPMGKLGEYLLKYPDYTVTVYGYIDRNEVGMFNEFHYEHITNFDVYHMDRRISLNINN